ncbi:MAG: GIY-YIG nuclease family protein [Bacteroidetes bacterium]|nr:GIY-YIG nuclease family protein [Bacteroidota bacterium]
MYKVYVLYSKEFNKIYIGYTSDLEDRFLSHNEKATKGFTVKYRPWEIAFFEEFETKPNAMKREKELKTSRGRTFVWDYLKSKGLIRQ